MESKIKIGKNAKENTEIVKEANKEYYWFHLDKFPSCSLIIEEKEINKEMIINCGKIVKERSKYKNIRNIKINYTKVKNIKILKEIGKFELKNNKYKTIII